MGWDVDFLGSICLIIVIGLSVDYTVHLCHSYTHCASVDRIERVRIAVVDMGVSIVSGAMTTFLASVFLLLCSMTFFKQFGVFMCLTVCYSLVFSIFFFMPLTLEIGPQRSGDAEGKSSGDLPACGKKAQVEPAT